MYIFYGRYLILQVQVDTADWTPADHLQLPEILPRIYLAPARKGKFDRLENRFENSLSLSWLYARLLDYRGGIVSN